MPDICEEWEILDREDKESLVLDAYPYSKVLENQIFEYSDDQLWDILMYGKFPD